MHACANALPRAQVTYLLTYLLRSISITGRGGPLWAAAHTESNRVSVNLVPLLLTGVPTRHDKHICRFFGAPACRVFPD